MWCVLDPEFTTLAHHGVSQGWYFLTNIARGIPCWDWGMAVASCVPFLTVHFAGGATKLIGSSAVTSGQGSSPGGAFARGPGRRAPRGPLLGTRSEWTRGRRPAERWHDIDRAVQRAPWRAVFLLACLRPTRTARTAPGRLCGCRMLKRRRCAHGSEESVANPNSTAPRRSELACEQKRGEAANGGGRPRACSANGSERSQLRVPRAITRDIQSSERSGCQRSASRRALPR